MAKSRARKLADIIVGAGIDIDGNLTFDGGSTSADLTFADGDKANFGDASDLQIYHNGSHSFIEDKGTGNLYIDGAASVYIRGDTGNTTSAVFNDGGSAAFYYNGSEKLETAPSGVTITGTALADAYNVSSTGIGTGYQLNGGTVLNYSGGNVVVGDLGAGVLLEYNSSTKLSTTSTGVDVTGTVLSDGLRFGTATDHTIKWGSGAEIVGIGSADQTIRIRLDPSDASNFGYLEVTDGSSNKKLLLVDDSGDISFYEDTGTDAKLFWDASAEALELSKVTALGDQNTKLAFSPANTVRLFTGGLERFRLDSSGNVGIGTNSPSSNLDIEGASEVRLDLNCTAGKVFRLRSTTSSDFAVRDSTAGADRLAINGSGNVGIGVTPASGIQLSIGNSANNSAVTRVTNGTVSVDLTASSSGKAFLEVGSNHPLILATNATEHWRIDTGGALSGTRAAIGKVIGENIAWNGTNYSNINTSYGASFLQMNSSGELYFRKTSAGSGNQAASYVFAVDSSGNFGIGTSSPAVPLEVVSTAANWTGSFKNYTANAYGLRVDLSNSSGNLYAFATYTATNTGFFVRNDGKTGIGTTSPSTSLHIDSGTATSQLTLARSGQHSGLSWSTLISDFTGGGADLIFDTTGANTGFGFRPRNSSGTQVNGLIIAPSGNVGIGTTSPAFITGSGLEVQRDGVATLRLEDTGSSGKALELSIDDSTGAIINSGSSGLPMIFKVINSEAMRLDTSGRLLVGRTASASDANADDVQIGNTSGAHGLTILSQNSHNGNIYFADNDNNDAGRIAYNHTNNRMEFFTNRSQRMVITSAGNVGIGTNSAGRALEVSTDGTAQFRLSRVDSTINGNNTLGTIEFWGTDDTSGTIGATIVGHAASTWGGGSYPTDLRFSTMETSTLSERMRITRLGDVSIGSDHGGFSGWKVLNIRQNSTGGMLNFEEDDGTRSFAFANQGVGMRYQAMITGGYHRFETHAMGNGTAMMITDAGNVGVSTASPANRLEVKASGNDNGIMLKSTTNADLIWLHQQTTSEGVLRIYGSGGAKVIIPGHNSPTYFNNGNNVGIGTTSPSAKLHVAGAIKGTDLIAHDSSGLALQTDEGTKRLVILDSGGVVVGGTSADTSSSMGGQNPVLFADGYTSLGGLRINGGDTGNTIYKTGGSLGITLGDGNVITLSHSSGTARLASGHWEVLDGKQLRAYRPGNSAYGALFMDTGENLYIRNSWGMKDLVFDRDGNLGIGTSNPSVKMHIVDSDGEGLRLENQTAAPTNSVSNAPHLEFFGRGWDSNYGSKPIKARIEHTATYGDYGYGATQGALIFSVQGAGGINSAPDTMQEGMRLAAGSDTYDFPRLGIGDTDPDGPLHVTSTGHTSIFEGTGGNVSLKLVRSDVSGAVDFGDIQFANSTGIAARINSRGEGGSASGNLTFQTRNTSGTLAERVRIDSSGNVGIGTTSPNRKLEVKDTSGYQLQLRGSNSFWNVGVGWAAYYQDYFLIANNTGDKVVIDSSGKVGIGTNSPITKTHIAHSTVINDHHGLLYVQNTASATGSSSNAGINVNNYTGTSQFMQWENHGLRIGSRRLFNGGAGDVVFTAGADSEKMRIKADGKIGIGRSSPNAKLDINAGTTKGIEIALGTSSVPFINFLYGATTVGSITTTGQATVYNTSSDQRLKDNIVDAPSASDDIDAIQVRSFDWKADGSHQKYGMVAQELQSVAPEAVTAPEDPEEMMGVDYSKLVPMLVKEIQSLRARVAELEGE